MNSGDLPLVFPFTRLRPGGAVLHHRLDRVRCRRWLALTAAVITAGGASFLLLPSAAALTGPAPSGIVRAEDGTDPSGADQPPANDAPAQDAGSPAADDGAASSSDTVDQPSSDGPSDGVDAPSDDPSADDPSADDPSADDPSADDPSADDPATDEPADEASNAPSDAASDLASASPEASAAAVPQVSIQGTPGTPIGAVTVAASGDGLAPSSTYDVVAYSVPRVIASGSADALGAFSVSATLPADLAPGAHTVVFRGTGADGQPVESGVGFTVAPDGSLGEVTGPVDAATLAALTTSQTAPGSDAPQAGAKSPAYAPVNPLDSPGAVVTTTIAALTLVTAVGAAAAGNAGGSRAGGAQGGGAPGGGSPNSGDAGGGVDAKVEDRRKRRGASKKVEDRADLDEDYDTTHNRGWKTRFQPIGTRPGDLSRSHRFPGTAFTDELSYVSILAVAPKSPLLARTIDDAGAWRALFGSLSLAFPIAGVALGIASAVNTGGIAQPPALALMIALVAVGVLDSLAGLLGMLAFTVGIAISGGIIDISSVRTLMGIALLVLGPGLMASSFRDTRRPAARTAAQWWERVTDLVVVPLMGGWITLSVVDALPGLAGYAFPIADSAGILALVVMALLVLNVLLEEAAARWFPERMATVIPSDRPEPGSIQMLISGLFRMGLFLFVSAAFVGNVWQLWVAAVLFTIPNLMRIVEDRLPNSPRLWQVLPMGLPQLGFMLIVSGIVAAAIASALGQTPQFAQMSFVILAVPGFVLDGLGAFGREPDEGDVRWYCRPRMIMLYRVGGVAVLLATVWLALNV